MIARGNLSKIVSAAVVVMIAILSSQLGARALEPKWPPGPYNYVVIEQDVKDALIEFGRNINLPIRVSDEVKGRLRGEFSAGAAKDFLDRLATSYGLVWYFDGSVLHVNAATEIKTEVIDLGRLMPSDVASKLARLGIADRRYPIRTAPGANIASVSGPPPYIALLRQTLAAMAKQPAPLPEDTSVRVFRGSTS
jgi:type II secretory pathway component GspD/PulD (secretin)